jgi:hypothetical protein
MRTTILAYVIALVGFVTIAVGAWDIIILLTDAPVEEVSLSDLAIAVGIVAGGFGLIGLAQALRLLAEFNEGSSANLPLIVAPGSKFQG